MERLNEVINLVNSYLWGPPLLILLFGTHLFMTVRTGFIQKKLGLAIKLSLSKVKTDGEGDVSHFGALATALASTIGTGNIIGVGTAITLGGPGALLWMWLTGIFGIATKYAESLIAIKYRVKSESGTMLGGAMYALERGLKLKFLGVLFAVFAAFAAFGIGSGVQSNAVATLMKESFNVPLWVSGLVITLVVAVTIIGGIKRISEVCVRLVPFMSVVYIIGCAVILVINRNFIIPALVEVGKNAFSVKAAGGGFAGAVVVQAMRYGIARGLFSNESGMGSAPIVAAAAKTRNAPQQALVSSSGVFWDTVIICALTGLVVISTVISKNIDMSTMNGGGIVHAAFGQIHFLGPVVLTFGLITFAFSTILGWSYYGERCAEYLLGQKVIFPYRVVYTCVTFVGTVLALDMVWSIADMLNALMAIPNLIAVLLLSGVIVKETNRYVYSGRVDDEDTDPVPFRTQLKK